MKNSIYLYGPPDSGKTVLSNIFLKHVTDEYEVVNYMLSSQRLSRVKLNKSDKVIFTFRDPRVCWFVSDHKLASLPGIKQFTINEYCNRHDGYFLRCDLFKDNPGFRVTKFEDLLSNFDDFIEDIFNFLGIDVPKDIQDSRPKAYFGRYTRFDVTRVVKFSNFVTQKEFDYISEKLSGLIDFLQYPKTLDVNQVTKSWT